MIAINHEDQAFTQSVAAQSQCYSASERAVGRLAVAVHASHMQGKHVRASSVEGGAAKYAIRAPSLTVLIAQKHVFT